MEGHCLYPQNVVILKGETDDTYLVQKIEAIWSFSFIEKLAGRRRQIYYQEDKTILLIFDPEYVYKNPDCDTFARMKRVILKIEKNEYPCTAYFLLPAACS